MTRVLSRKLRKRPVMADNDPNRPSQQTRHASPAVLCSRHEEPCFSGELYLVSLISKG